MTSILDRFRVMPDKQLAEAKLELANSYRDMMKHYAWKHLNEEMDKIYGESFKSLDQCDIRDFDVALAAEGRGMRKAIDAIRKRVENASR